MTTLERPERTDVYDFDDEVPAAVRASFRLWGLSVLVGLVPPVAGAVIGALWVRSAVPADRGLAMEFTTMSAFFLIVSIMLLGSVLALATRMRRGKRWARTALSVVTLLGLVWAVQSFAGVFGSGTLLDTIRMISAAVFVVLTVAATVCMYRSSARLHFGG